jgi:hypothetical protein
MFKHVLSVSKRTKGKKAIKNNEQKILASLNHNCNTLSTTNTSTANSIFLVCTLKLVPVCVLIKKMFGYSLSYNVLSRES